jgi:AcrR family transcriptional regulator
MSRDIDASREAILAAAEVAFADQGYDGASLQVIADAAGVSRGMPGYAFGSKAKLYEAVLERAFAQPRALAARLAAMLGDGGEEELDATVAAYIDFLASHPLYVRLLQRAALDGGGRLGHGPAHVGALEDAVTLVGDFFTPATGDDPRQLLVSLLAMCFFPFAHRDTLLAPLGLDADDPTFLAERKAHVLGLLHEMLDR